MDLFAAAASTEHGVPVASEASPLAVRMRPRRVEDVVGQSALLQPGSPLMRLLEPPTKGSLPPSSVILYGPPGTGKTTLAYLVAQRTGRRFEELSAVSAGVKDIRAVVTEARHRLAVGGEPTVLFIDEVHRFSKSQQDALLPAVENQWVTLIAATTENPSFSVISPLLSRSLLLRIRPLADEDIRALLERALSAPEGLAGRVALGDEAAALVVRFAAGDARKALTILEAAAGAAINADAASDTDTASDTDAASDTDGVRELTADDVTAAIDVAAIRYDRGGDEHYDVVSAFIKSMRGSDVDAALHYLARMITAGEDPRFIARRIVIAAAEEVGLADPSALQTAVAAAQAVQLIGMPEGRIPLAEAVVHVATAPKSNASYVGINRAIADIEAGKSGPVPPHLRDAHYAGAKRLGHGLDYVYAHDEPHAVAAQQYLPDELDGARYYEPSDRGFERQVSERLTKVRSLLRRQGPAPE